MEKTVIDEVPSEPNLRDIHEIRRPVSDALGTENVAMNFFELTPGELFSPGLHAHHDQEEIFYVVAGRAEFTVGRERETVTVEEGEMIRFAPGEFQTGYVPESADEHVAALAIGAPGTRHSWGEDLVSLVYCRECEAEHPHESRPADDRTGFELTCTVCKNEFVVR